MINLQGSQTPAVLGRRLNQTLEVSYREFIRSVGAKKCISTLQIIQIYNTYPKNTYPVW